MKALGQTLQLAGVTLGVAALLVWLYATVGPRSVWFALGSVWLPMTWLGTVSKVFPLRLPEAWHAVRPWEPRAWERLGVRWVKRVLRRGPMAVFNPGLRLPAEPTPESLAVLARRMCEAEASHAILLVATLGLVVHAGVRGWWATAAWTLLFDVVVNGYPVMLQRYNRALLAQGLRPTKTGGPATVLLASKRGD